MMCIHCETGEDGDCQCDEIARLKAEIERLREERRWISVEERLPERGVRVLVTLTPDSKGRREVCEAALNYEHFFETDYGSYEASHWIPLPSPPEEGK